MLKLTLLGRFRAELGGLTAPVRLPTQKAVGILGFLALHTETQMLRSDLASLLWNDVPLSQGRHSLRQELMHIRTALGRDVDTYLYADREIVALHRDRMCIDSDYFAELVGRRTSDSMREACAIYQGELLSKLHTRERKFDSWLETTRAGLRDLAIFAHEWRLDELTDRGETTEALAIARHLLYIDPARESAHRRLMLLTGDSDDSGAFPHAPHL